MKILIFGQDSYICKKYIKYVNERKTTGVDSWYKPDVFNDFQITTISFRNNIIHNYLYDNTSFKDSEFINKMLDENNVADYDVIINLVGDTGLSNIDDLLRNENSMKICAYINTIWPVILKQYIDKNCPNTHFIHFSSGCIFNGYDRVWDYTNWDDLIKDKDYLLSRCPSLYSLTKLNAELKLVDTILDNMTIIRIRMPFDEHPDSKNYITKILKYKNVLSMQNSMTYIPYLFYELSRIISTPPRACGIFNLVDGNFCARDFLDNLVLPYKLNNVIYDSYEEFKKNTPIKDNRSNCLLVNNYYGRAARSHSLVLLKRTCFYYSETILKDYL